MRRRLRRLQVQWMQAVCGYRGHGTVYLQSGHMAVFCRNCGWNSSGVWWTTHHVRMLWMRDKQRSRFRAMKRIQKAS